VNANLRALIPNGSVEYEHTQVLGDLKDAIARIEAEYREKLAPPPNVLKKALYVVYRKRSAVEADSITYVVKQYKVFGLPVCVGWREVAHPLDGGSPQAFYVVGACQSDGLAPPWGSGLPAPGASATPSAAPSPR
jgi:hypothetical protein